MRIKNVRPSISRVYLCGIFLACLAFPVSAQITAGDVQAAIDEAKWRKYVANIRVNSQSTPVSLPAGATSGKVGIKLLEGVPSLTTAGQVSVAGKAVPISTTLKLGAAATGKLAVALLKASPYTAAFAAGSAALELYDALADSNISVKKDPAGNLIPLKLKTGEIEEWSGGNGFWDTDKMAAAQVVADSMYLPGSYYSPVSATPFSETRFGVYSNSPNAPGMYLTSFSLVSRIRVQNTADPLTEQQLVDEIASKSGWPSGTLEKITKTAIESGIEPDLESAVTTVSGPSTVGEPKVTTKNLPDGKVETTTEKTNITYQGSNIKVDNSSVVTNYNPTTNTTNNVSDTTIENPDLPKPDPKDQCEKYPDSIGCAKFGEPPASVPLKKTERALNITAAAFTSSAACPAPVQLAVMGQNYEIPYDPLCDKLALIKPLMMLFAAFVAAYVLADSFKV